VILNIYLNICYGFNVDTASIERFTGVSESMFGYSSALHTNNEGSWFVFLLYFIFKKFLFKIHVYYNVSELFHIVAYMYYMFIYYSVHSYFYYSDITEILLKVALNPYIIQIYILD
jgi:hypothetical protein